MTISSERPGLSSAAKEEMWVRYRAGESCASIGRALGKATGSVYAVVRAHGGIAPAIRRRARGALTVDEREVISRGVAAGESVRAMAQGLGRAPSTISREITRNGGLARYRASTAETRARRAAGRPKPTRLATFAPLRRLVDAKLRLRWSPAQIAGWLRMTYPDDLRYHVSHETIYRSLFVQARGVLKQELTAHLRTRRPMRRSKKASAVGQSRGRIVDAVSIPVVASGGAGHPQHLADAILLARADAVLAASIFHFGQYTIAQTKSLMAEQGIPVRLR